MRITTEFVEGLHQYSLTPSYPALRLVESNAVVEEVT